jgi:UDP-N-acetylmuramoylalanine--D-glutamate ligase
MIPVTSFAGRKVAVFGLGGSGLVSALALKAGGAEPIACDDDPRKMADAAAAGIATADLRHFDWSTLAALVLTPGAPLTHPAPHWTVGLARAAAVEVIGDIELFCRERRRHARSAPFVAITGTNGKSTTTALTAHLMRAAGYDAQMGGNIGTAILSLEPPQAAVKLAQTAYTCLRVHVIEVSSYQVDLAPSLDPSVGILINVSEDHIDRHGSLRNYAAVKERLVAGVQENGTAIVGVDDNWCAAAADRIARVGKTVVRVSVRRPLPDGLYVEADAIMQAAGGTATAIARLGGIGSLRGVHNAQNAACASGAALALGLDADTIQRGLRSFPGLAHRMEEIGRAGRVLFVNDSKATNADSAAQALACFSDIFWIVGGKPKTGGLATLTGFFPRIRKAYLIGEAAAGFAAELDDRVPHVIAGTLERAVALAARDAEAADIAEPVVLLSPACASFDQYRNFEVRGDAFRELVLALPGLLRAAR